MTMMSEQERMEILEQLGTAAMFKLMRMNGMETNGENFHKTNPMKHFRKFLQQLSGKYPFFQIEVDDENDEIVGYIRWTFDFEKNQKLNGKIIDIINKAEVYYGDLTTEMEEDTDVLQIECYHYTSFHDVLNKIIALLKEVEVTT